MQDTAVIPGLVLRELTAHADARGELIEVHRNAWPGGIVPLQWNFVRARARSLRGVHLHRAHADQLCVVEGRMLLGLRDCRSETGAALLLTLEAARPTRVTIPIGVAHGFYFPAPALLLYCLDAYWDASDELGCRFDDPALGIDWPDAAPELSPRDRAAGGFAAMLRDFRQQPS